MVSRYNEGWSNTCALPMRASIFVADLTVWSQRPPTPQARLLSFLSVCMSQQKGEPLTFGQMKAYIRRGEGAFRSPGDCQVPRERHFCGGSALKDRPVCSLPPPPPHQISSERIHTLYSKFTTAPVWFRCS